MGRLHYGWKLRAIYIAKLLFKEIILSANEWLTNKSWRCEDFFYLNVMFCEVGSIEIAVGHQNEYVYE